MKRFHWFLLVLCCLAQGVLPSAEAAPFKGKVLSPDGAPVAGATLWLGPVGLQNYSEKNGTIFQLKTGDDGSFAQEIALPEGQKSSAFVRVRTDKYALYDGIIKSGDVTLKLQAGKTIKGTVKNEQGQPLADIPVRVTFAPGTLTGMEEDLGGGGPMGFMSLMVWVSSLPAIETKSGADGKWTFDGLNIAIMTTRDARYVTQPGFVGIPGVPGASGDSVTLIAKPATTLKGRITTPEGKPLPGALIIGNEMDMFNELPRTDAEGKFVLRGIAPDKKMVAAIAPDNDWIIPPLEIKEPLQLGKENEAPAWVATRGIELRGVVVDKKTGAPVAGAKINTNLGNGQTTGADGKFMVRVPEQQVFVSVMHPDYGNAWKQFDKVAGPTYDLGKFSLDRTYELTGRLIDDKGAPVPNMMIFVISSGEMPSNSSAQTDADGNFKAKAPLGEVRFILQNDEWELAAGREFKTTFAEKQAPIEVKARKLPLIAVKGRLLTPGGAPVAKASVTLQASLERKNPDYIEMRTRTAETDDKGNFTANFTGDVKEPKVIKIDTEGYLLRKSGKAKLQDGAWQLEDSTAALLNAQVSGRVLSAAGAPLAGALVASPEAATFTTVKTDADGRFQLAKLPEGEAVVIAAHGRDFARVSVPTKTETGPAVDVKNEVKMAPPSVFVAPMRRQFFEQVAKNSLWDLQPYWASIGSDKMLALALQKDGALPAGEFDTAKADWAKSGASVLQVLQMSLEKDSPWLLKNGAALLQKVPPLKDKSDTARFDAESSLAVAAAILGDEAARAAANQWLDAAQRQKEAPNENLKNASRLFRLAGVAGALGRANANDLVIAAMNYADAAGKKSIEENAYQWGQSLGPAGPQAFDAMEGEWTFSARVKALAYAANRMPHIDLARGKALLDKLLALRDSEEWKKNGAGNGELTGQVTNAQSQWRRAQAKVDPAAYLAWTETDKKAGWDTSERLTAVRAALQKGKDDVALRLMRSAASQNYAGPGTMALFATFAAPLDAELSKQLWDKAEAQAMEKLNQDNNQLDGVAQFAYYRANAEPARMRLILEDAWQRTQKAAAAQGENYWSETPLRVAAAMIALDVPRAIEMLGEVSKDYQKQRARARIAVYLLADDATRAVLPVENE